MNVKWMLVPAVLATISLVADAAEPAKNEGWTQKQFIITFWCPPPATDQALAAVAAEHYNLTWVPVEGLDVAAKHKLRAMLTSDLLNPATLDDAAKRAQLDALIEKVKNHPAMEAYYITDEPGAGAFPGLGKLVAYLRERDPAHLAYINLFPTYANEAQLGVSADAAERAKVGYPQNFAGVGTSDKTVLAYREHLKKFVEIVKPDLISYDHYHFMKESDGGQYFLNLALIRDAALEAGKPFLNIIQAVHDREGVAAAQPRGDAIPGLHDDGLRRTRHQLLPLLGPGELRRTLPRWQAVAHGQGSCRAQRRDRPVRSGADGTGFHGASTTPRLCPTEPRRFRPTAPVQFTGSGEFVLGLFGKNGKTTAFMVVNRSYKQDAEAAVKVAIPGSKLQELDRTTGKWSDGQVLDANREVKIKLAPGDGRLFRAGE